MKIFKRLSTTALLAITVFSSSSIWAGANLSIPVVIGGGGSSITGNFGATRNSANPIEFLEVIDIGATMIIRARNAAGVFASCTTGNPVMHAQLRGLTSEGLIRVAINGGACVQLQTWNSSRLQPI